MEIYNSPSGELLGNRKVNLLDPSVITDSKKKNNIICNQSKWANLKFFLRDKSYLEASVDLLKTKVAQQFFTKCKEIYTKKIEIHLQSEKNRKLISKGIKQFEGGYEDISSQITVSNGISELPTDAIQTFLFMFRENNHLMLKLIDKINKSQYDILAPFLCHFFYENFYMESTEQEEIIYILYLLLEKDIDKLYALSEQTFLDQSFISKILEEMSIRYEIKNYIDFILNELICSLEELDCNFYSLDINEILKNPKIEETFEIVDEDEVELKPKNEATERSINLDSNQSNVSKNMEENIKDKNNSNKKDIKKLQIEFLEEKDANNSLIYNLPKDISCKITERFLIENFEKEENDVIRQFFFKQIKKIKASHNPLLFSPHILYEYLKKIKKKKKTLDSIDQFNKGVNLVICFIDNLLSNLENSTIAPYSIKVICKFIYILMKKKFKNITQLELNNFVGRFLFDKLILPILRNPDRNDVGKSRIISLNTRKNLINVYLVFKNLVKGEFFNIDQNINFSIFNKYIMDNYYKVNNIIKKMIDVKIPEKLKKLSEEFYENNDFVLDNSKRSEEEINYQYFKENPNDFIQYKSICFRINEFNIFYSVVEEYKDLFFQKGEPLEKIFEIISKFISMIKGKYNHYFVIISDKYNEQTEKLLFNKEKILPLEKAKTQEEIIQNLHYCISYLLGNLEILPQWNWAIKNYQTMPTFQYINNYLNSYEGINNICPGPMPLNLCSLYIINNLHYVKPGDSINDYQPLYDNIVKQIRRQQKKLSELKEFLRVNMTTKFLLIDYKIKIFNEELENIKKTFINIITLQFKESKKSLNSFASLKNLREIIMQVKGETKFNKLFSLYKYFNT